MSRQLFAHGPNFFTMTTALNKTTDPIADLRPMLGAAAVAIALSIPLGIAVAALASGGGGNISTGASSVLGAGTVAAGVVAGVVVLSMPGQRTRSRLALGVLASSTARMLVALLVGVAVFFVGKPQPYAFFGAFLAAGLLCLAAEAVWAIAALRRAQLLDSQGLSTPNAIHTDGAGHA